MSNNIENLSPISKFPQSSGISDDDLFLISKKSGTSYTSQRLSYGTLKTVVQGSSGSTTESSQEQVEEEATTDRFQLGQAFGLAKGTSSKNAVYDVAADGIFSAVENPQEAYINGVQCTSYNIHDAFYTGETVVYRYVVNAGDQIVIGHQSNDRISFHLAYFVDGISEGTAETSYEYSIGDLYDWYKAGTMGTHIPTSLITSPSLTITETTINNVVLVSYMTWGSSSRLNTAEDEITRVVIPGITADIYSSTDGHKTNFYCVQKQRVRTVSHTASAPRFGKTTYGVLFKPYTSDRYFVRLADIRNAKVKFTKIKKYTATEEDA